MAEMTFLYSSDTTLLGKIQNSVTSLKYLYIGLNFENQVFFQFEIIITVLQLALFASFEYLCYGDVRPLEIF